MTDIVTDRHYLIEYYRLQLNSLGYRHPYSNYFVYLNGQPGDIAYYQAELIFEDDLVRLDISSSKYSQTYPYIQLVHNMDLIKWINKHRIIYENTYIDNIN